MARAFVLGGSRVNNQPGGTFHAGDRVEIHPRFDLWMRGDRYGTVVKDSKLGVYVLMDKLGKRLRYGREDLTLIERARNPRHDKPRPVGWRGVPEKHLLRIARENWKHPAKARFLGGPTPEQARSIITTLTGKDPGPPPVDERLKNPYGKRAKYRHKRLRRPSRFVPGTLRLTRKRKGVRVVVGKLKGERRRVRRGKRRGRPVLTAQAVLTAKRGRNPVAYSERKAWRAVRTIAQRLASHEEPRTGDEADLGALVTLADYMLEQLGRGVHANPALAIFGVNPPRKAGLLSDNVQAVLYRHVTDGKDYVHPFGKGVTVVNKRDGSTVVRAAVSARSGVRATLLSDGSVLLRHPTKPLWRDF
jgi:hypothetical protein